MAKIQRTTQEIFASTTGSQQITAFGTAKNDAPQYTTDVSQIQNTNFLNGWSSAVLPDKAPWEEDMNALFYAITSQLTYLFQQGIPEYDSGTEYYIGSLVKNIDSNGTVTVYKSTSDQNIGNPLTDENNWIIFQSDGASGIASYEIGLPQPTLSNTLLSNEIWLVGQEVSRTTYSQLFEIYGTTYGEGDGSTTFNLPDCRNRVMWGSNDFGYIEAGLPSFSVPINGSNADLGDPGNFYITNGGQFNGTRYLSVAGSTIYGNSNTVQPPAIKVRVKTRFK